MCGFCDEDGSTSKFSSSLERSNVINGVCCPSQKSHARPTIRQYYCKPGLLHMGFENDARNPEFSKLCHARDKMEDGA